MSLIEDDTEVIKQAQKGEDTAWCDLIERYAGIVWSATFKYTFSKEEREEIVQEAFLRLVRSISNYNPDKSAFSTFLTTITNRVCIDLFRKPPPPISVLPDELEKLAKGPPFLQNDSSEKDDNRQKMIDRLRGLLKELPREERLAIYLFYFNRCSYDRIAEVMDKDFNWVKNTLYRTKKRLLKNCKKY